jgi:hypothetical protein
METIICQHCGSTDYITTETGPHLKASCKACGKYIKFLPQHKSKPILYFGKYKGREIPSMTLEEEIQYLKWMLKTCDLKVNARVDIENHLRSLNRL